MARLAGHVPVAPISDHSFEDREDPRFQRVKDESANESACPIRQNPCHCPAQRLADRVVDNPGGAAPAGNSDARRTSGFRHLTRSRPV